MYCNNATQNIKMRAMWEMARKRWRVIHATSMQSHGGANRALEPMTKTSPWAPKITNKALTREPMIGMLYNINHDTFTMARRICVKTQWS
jgi:hypothetical protein